MDFQNVINDNGNENENENNIRKQRSTLSLEGGKIPFSLYTRRIIKAEKIPELLNDESTKGLCGTINFGSSCYMNSVLTSLNNCQELVYYFLKGDYKKDLNTLEPKIVEAFGDLVEEYWVKQTEAVLPEKFKDSIEEKLPHFNGYKQQDANEFLITTLNLLNEGLKNEVFNENNEQVQVELDKSDEENSKKFWNFNLKYNDSIITDLFCGQLKQTIKCPECRESKIKFECFNILNLPIAKNENKYIYKFHFYYVPKYGIRRTVKIYYNKYKNDATFAELFENLKNEEKFLYKNKIDKLIINRVYNKKSDGFIDDKTTLEESIKEKTYYFCYDSEEGKNKGIVIYMKKEGEPLSQYPHIIFTSQDENLDDFRLNIYYLIRKYICSPLKGDDIEYDDLTKDIIKYIKKKSIEEEPIINSIKEEYNTCFKSEDLNENVRLFIENLPFKIFLINKNDKNDKVLFSSNFKDLSEEFKEKTNIRNFNESIESLTNILNDYEFLIEFNPNSDYINKYTFNLNTVTKCNCNYKEKDNNNNIKLSLDECLKSFIKEEKLSKGEEWDCPYCFNKVLAKKKIEFYYLPKIFIICFARFTKENNELVKNEEDIEFKINDMDMKEYMIGPDREHSIYDLFAIIQHYGTIENGHYISICNNSGRWYKYDDSQIRNVDINEQLGPKSYILFYRRKTD